MSETIIKIENLSKAYRLGVINHGMLYKDIQSWWARKRGKEDPHSKLGMYNREQLDGEDLFWALKDINLEVKQGDRIGIIGKNGAGKSTLLKVLSRVTAPTSGSVKVKGRIASLLEVGTGFHPELTGRENVYLNGAILGMTKTEISRKFDEIVDFAGIGKFIDTPVKRYSSGMYVRLAFAVAAHLEPEILIVDEVLAVGDIEFQKKALGKMEDVSRKDGRTILFVSHNLAAVTNLCNLGIVLEKGSIIFQGDAPSSVSHYTERFITNDITDKDNFNSRNTTVRFISGQILNTNGDRITSVSIFDSFYVEMVFFIGDKVNGIPVPNFHFKTGDGVYAFVVNANDVNEMVPGKYKARCKIPKCIFNEGVYTIGLAITEYLKNSLVVHFYEDNYLTLNVIDPIFENPYRYGYGGSIPGVLRPILEWDVKRIEGEE